MKTKKLEKWLLLEQSGELSPRRRRVLQHELAVSKDARMLRDELHRLKGSVMLPDVDPSPWTVAKISARLQKETSPVQLGIRVWKPVLAVAAGLAITVGIWNFHGAQVSSVPVVASAAAGVDVWNSPFEEDLTRLESLVTAANSSSFDIMEM